MPSLTEEQFILMKFLATGKKPVNDVFKFQPPNVIWPTHLSGDVLDQIHSANLINDEDVNYVELNKLGYSVLKRHKRKLLLKSIEEFPKQYWPVVAIFTYILGVITPIAIERWKSQGQEEKRPTQLQLPLQHKDTTKKG